MKTVLYYRGSLSSCNYDCPYCPFSKNKDSAEVLAEDKAQLLRFTDWVKEQGAAGHRLSIFFNPYGEALIHRGYREAMVELSHLEHVDKVAVQTNLSAGLEWTRRLNPQKAAFWATYHPGQVTETAFLKQCLHLHRQGIRFSVGTVGVRSAFPAIRSLRETLPREVYLWVNAFKDRKGYYTREEIDMLCGIDPYVEWNVRDYESLGRSCRAGADVFYVQGSGIVKRCYQDRRVIGHLYRDGLAGLTKERPCGMKMCGCYIGYIHMPELGLEKVYGPGLLERIPVRPAEG